MKTIGTIILTTALLFVPTGARMNAVHTDATQETYVYICTGPQSKRYHSKSNCRGLNSCSGSIEKVTLTKAQSMHRTPCKVCL